MTVIDNVQWVDNRVAGGEPRTEPRSSDSAARLQNLSSVTLLKTVCCSIISAVNCQYTIKQTVSPVVMETQSKAGSSKQLLNTIETKWVDRFYYFVPFFLLKKSPDMIRFRINSLTYLVWRLFFSPPLKGIPEFICGVRCWFAQVSVTTCAYFNTPEICVPLSTRSGCPLWSTLPVHPYSILTFDLSSSCVFPVCVGMRQAGRGQTAHVCACLNVWQKGPALWTSA